MSRVMRILFFTALVTFLPMLIDGDAEAARRSGLAGNLLIEDADDVFIFPQHNITYANRFIVDMGAGGSDGSGTLLFGTDSWAVNFSTHRSDYLNSIVNGYWNGTDRGIFSPRFSPDISGPSDQEPLDLQWFDLGFGTSMGENTFGLRVGTGVDNETGSSSAGLDVKNTAYVMAIQAGIGLGESFDAAGEISFGSSQDKDSSDPDPDLEGSVTQFSVGARGYYESGDFEFGYLGAFAYGSSDVDAVPAPPDTTPVVDEDSITMFMVGWGPVWRSDPGNWQVAGYVTFEWQQETEKPASAPAVDEDKSRYITVPGFRLAAESRVWRGLWARGGVRSDYSFFKGEVKDSSGGSIESNVREYDFRWTAGLSVYAGSFRLDGAINEPWVTTGPNIIGNDTDFLAYVSATYAWGD